MLSYTTFVPIFQYRNINSLKKNYSRVEHLFYIFCRDVNSVELDGVRIDIW